MPTPQQIERARAIYIEFFDFIRTWDGQSPNDLQEHVADALAREADAATKAERKRAAQIVKEYVKPGESSREFWPLLRHLVRATRADVPRPGPKEGQ